MTMMEWTRVRLWVRGDKVVVTLMGALIMTEWERRRQGALVL